MNYRVREGVVKHRHPPHYAGARWRESENKPEEPEKGNKEGPSAGQEESGEPVRSPDRARLECDLSLGRVLLQPQVHSLPADRIGEMGGTRCENHTAIVKGEAVPQGRLNLHFQTVSKLEAGRRSASAARALNVRPTNERAMTSRSPLRAPSHSPMIVVVTGSARPLCRNRCLPRLKNAVARSRPPRIGPRLLAHRRGVSHRIRTVRDCGQGMICGKGRPTPKLINWEVEEDPLLVSMPWWSDREETYVLPDSLDNFYGSILVSPCSIFRVAQVKTLFRVVSESGQKLQIVGYI